MYICQTVEVHFYQLFWLEFVSSLTFLNLLRVCVYSEISTNNIFNNQSTYCINVLTPCERKEKETMSARTRK